jgi:phenylacetate-CoA ligase
MIEHLRQWLHRRGHPVRYAQLEQLLHNQALSREEVLRKQRRDLADLVAFAAGNTAYYAEKLAPFLGDASQPAQLGDLPILSKDGVASRLDDLLARDADRSRVKIGHTGGSTGKPLAFWYDEAKHELMRAGMMRGFMMSGWRPGQKVLYFWGARHDTVKGGVFGGSRGAHWGAHLGDLIAAEKTIAAVEFSEAKLHEWARFIQTWRPVLLYGYASALSELARYIRDSKMAMPRSLLGVYSTAEVLDGWQRELMQQAFACKVFNQYGCREVPNIAWECRQGNMHVFADLVCLESVPMEGEDRLLVTSLSNRLMPFIRYDIGDSGRLLDGGCACGSPFPLLEMGLCRQNDLIRTRAGKRFHPAYFNRLLYGMTQLGQYQWVQHDLDRLSLNVVAATPLSCETLAALRESLRRDVDAEMRLEVNYLAEIPRTASGKHRFVIGLPERS